MSLPGLAPSAGQAHHGWMTDERPPAWLAPVLVAHLVVATLVWRDLARRPADRVRGSKKLWRLLSAANTSGSVAYVLVGRRA